MRQLIDAGSKIVDSAFQPAGRDSQEVLAQAEQAVFRIAEHGRRGRQDYVALRDAMRDAFPVLQDRYEKPYDVTGVPTGDTMYDLFTAGFQPSELLLLAAGP